MYFKIVGEISYVETFAVGSAIREVARLRKLYGRGRWRKRKGVARVRLDGGLWPLPRFTGMRRQESARWNSRSSGSFEHGYDEISEQTAVGSLRKERGVRRFPRTPQDLCRHRR